MSSLQLNPDEPLLQYGPIVVNRTLLFTWITIACMSILSWLITRHMAAGGRRSRLQNSIEVIVLAVRRQIAEISRESPDRFLPFVATLFLFLGMSNLLAIIPGFVPPTASLSTTAALATCVLVAVPFFGVTQQGPRAYLKQYVQPSVFMLPFNVIGEASRTLALAVRLYGNMMSATVIGAILLAFVPLFVPVVMQLFGLLTGLIQAYIFSVLAMVYIASAIQAQKSSPHAASETLLDTSVTGTE